MTKEKDISGRAPGGERTRLADVLPLDTPYVIQIFPIYACNFRCNYCIFQIDKDKRGFISDKVVMDFDLFKKCVDEMTVFPQKIKVLRFVGIGEPLLHKKITEMVDYATSREVTQKVEILTNGSLLTPKMSDALIKAGLSRLVVSLQGTSAEKYKNVCGANIDFDRLVDNLRYFFDNKGNIHMYVKVVDTALDGKEDEQKFYEIFGNICDSMAVEHTVPIHSGVDYEKIIKMEGVRLTQFGLPVIEVEVCPQPFFTMQINPDGKVVPCYSFEYPKIVGNCYKDQVHHIWNGQNFQQFRNKMLDGVQTNETCSNCNIIKFRSFTEDDLSNDVERLKKLYNNYE